MPPKPLRQPTRKEAIALPQNARFNYLSQASQLLASDGYLDAAAYFGSQALKAAGSQGAAVPRRSALQHCEVCGVFLSPSSCTSIECVNLSRRNQLRAAAAASSSAAPYVPSSGGGKGSINVVAIVRACRVCGHRNSQPFAAAHVARQVAEAEARALEQYKMERQEQKQPEQPQEALLSDQQQQQPESQLLQQQPESQLTQLQMERLQQPEVQEELRGPDTEQEQADNGNREMNGAEAVTSSDEPAATTAAAAPDAAAPADETPAVPCGFQDAAGGIAEALTAAADAPAVAPAGKGATVAAPVYMGIKMAQEGWPTSADGLKVPQEDAGNGATGTRRDEWLGGDPIKAAEAGHAIEAAAAATVAAVVAATATATGVDASHQADEVMDTETAVDAASAPAADADAAYGVDNANRPGEAATVDAANVDADAGIIVAAAGNAPERAAGTEGEPAVVTQPQVEDDVNAAAATAQAEADVEGISRSSDGAGSTQPVVSPPTSAALEEGPAVEEAPGNQILEALVVEKGEQQHPHSQQPVASSDGNNVDDLFASAPPILPSPEGGDEGGVATEVVVTDSAGASQCSGRDDDAPKACAAAPAAAPVDVTEAVAASLLAENASTEGMAGEVGGPPAVAESSDGMAVTDAGVVDGGEEQQSSSSEEEEDDEAPRGQPGELEAASGGQEEELATVTEKEKPAAEAAMVLNELENAVAAFGIAARDANAPPGKATAASVAGAADDAAGVAGDVVAAGAGDIPASSSGDAAEAADNVDRGTEEQSQQVVMIASNGAEEDVGTDEDVERSNEALGEEEEEESADEDELESDAEVVAAEGMTAGLTGAPTAATAVAEKEAEIVNLVSEDGEEAAVEMKEGGTATTAAPARRAAPPQQVLAAEAPQAVAAAEAPLKQQQPAAAVAAAAAAAPPLPESATADLESQRPCGTVDAGGQEEENEEEEDEEEEEGEDPLSWNAAFGVSSEEDESEGGVDSDEEDDGEEEQEQQQAALPAAIVSKATSAVPQPKPAALLKPIAVKLAPASAAKTSAAAAAAAEVAAGDAAAAAVDSNTCGTASFEAAAAPSTVKRRRVQLQEPEPQPAALHVLLGQVAHEPRPHELAPPVQESTELTAKKKEKTKLGQRSAGRTLQQEQQGGALGTGAAGGRTAACIGEDGIAVAAVVAVPACVRGRADRSAPVLSESGTAVMTRRGEQPLWEAPAAAVRSRQQKQKLQSRQQQQEQEQPRRKRPRGYPGWLPEGFVSETSILPLLPKEREDGVLVYEAPYAPGLFDLRPVVELEWPQVLHHPRHRRRVLRDSALFSAHHARFTGELQRHQQHQVQHPHQHPQSQQGGAVLGFSVPVGGPLLQLRAADSRRQVAVAAVVNGSVDGGGGRLKRAVEAVEVVVSAGDGGGGAGLRGFRDCTAAPSAKAVSTVPAAGRGGSGGTNQLGGGMKQQVRLDKRGADRLERQQQRRIWQEVENDEDDDDEDDDEEKEGGSSSDGDGDPGDRMPRIGPWAKLPPWDSSALSGGGDESSGEMSDEEEDEEDHEEEDEEGPVQGVAGRTDRMGGVRRRSLTRKASAGPHGGKGTIKKKEQPKRSQRQARPRQSQPQSQSQRHGGQLAREPHFKEAGERRKRVQWAETASGDQHQLAQRQHSQHLRAKKQRR